MKVPLLVQQVFSSVIWRIPTTNPVLYLTFDDGPNPAVTFPVLEILKSFQAKATFFCVGENIVQHSPVYEKILEDGHATGNHTFHHLNGWKTGTREYLLDIQHCDGVLKKEIEQSESGKGRQKFTLHTQGQIPQTIIRYPKLFRPPYGKLNPFQYSKLKSAYSIVMWDVLSRDYDHKISKEICLGNVISHAQSGSIVVFHDSLKAKENLLFSLPKVLEYFSKKNYSFNSLASNVF